VEPAEEEEEPRWYWETTEEELHMNHFLQR
jgi:hypothetical protein